MNLLLSVRVCGWPEDSEVMRCALLCLFALWCALLLCCDRSRVSFNVHTPQSSILFPDTQRAGDDSSHAGVGQVSETHVSLCFWRHE